MGSSVILPGPGQPKTGPDPGFVQSPSRQWFDFAHNNLAPPSPLYMGPDTFLRVLVNSSIAGAVLNIEGRILTEQNRIIPIQFNFPIPQNRSAQFFTGYLGEGFLLSLSAGIGNIVTTRGQVFVNIGLNQGQGSGAFAIAILAADYVTAQSTVIWPGGRFLSPVEGPGNLRSILGSVPAAAAEVSEVVPTNARWRPMSFRFTLTTSAGVGNRQVHMQVDDGANAYWTSTFIFSQPASTSQVYSATPGITPQNDAGGFNMLTLPSGLNIPAGHRIRTNTAGLLAGDQYTAPQYLVEEWLDQ